MSDLDIEIKVAVKEAIAGLAQVDAATKKTEHSFEALEKKLHDQETAARRAREQMTGLARDTIGLGGAFKQAQDAASASSAQQLANFKQVAAAGAQAWGVLSQKLDIADTAIGETIDSAVKFGSIGAQVAGPWGAAIGAIGGGLLALGEHFDSAGKAAMRMIDAANAPGIYRARQAWLESALAIERVGAQLQALEGLRKGQALAAAVPGLIAVQEYNEELARQKTLYEKITGPQREYHEQIDSLNAMFKANKIDATQFDAAIRELNRGFESDAPKHYADRLKEVRDVFAQFVAAQRAASGAKEPYAGYNRDEMLKAAERAAAEGDAASGARLFAKPLNTAAPAYDGNSSDRAEREAEAVKRIAVNTRSWNIELEESQQRMAELREFTRPMENAFANLFATGEFGWRKMIDAMIADAARLAASKLFSGSLFGPSLEDGLVRSGAPGIMPLAQASAPYFSGSHAFGGSYIVPGEGGVDSVHLLSRVSPGERVDFTPPGRAPAEGQQPSAAQQVVVQVVDQRDPRALMQTPEFRHAVRQVVLDSGVLLRGGR